MVKLSQEYEDLPPTPVVAKALLEFEEHARRAMTTHGAADYSKTDQAALDLGACLMLKCMIRDGWVEHIYESTK